MENLDNQKIQTAHPKLAFQAASAGAEKCVDDAVAPFRERMWMQVKRQAQASLFRLFRNALAATVAGMSR